MKIRKLVSTVLAGMICVSTLAGCSSNGSDTKEAKGDGAQSDGKVTIRLLTRMAGTTKQVEIYNDIIDEFKAKYPDVKIVDDSQGDESAFNNILSTDIASGTMANISVFRVLQTYQIISIMG